VARQKDYENDEFPWGEFLLVVITGKYNVPHCWPFSGTDAHPPSSCNKPDKHFSSQL